MQEGEQVHWVDCYNGGIFLDHQLTDELRGRVPLHQLERALNSKRTAEEVLCRALRNLIHAYQLLEQQDRANLMRFLLKTTELGEKDLGWPAYQPGQLVVDDKAGYRGVVVDYDLRFRPRFSERDQSEDESPYYLILVDGSSAISYSREARLRADDSGREVNHPYLGHFFTGFEEGKYLRNNQPWPLI